MPEWKKLTSDKEILSTVTGLNIEFDDKNENLQSTAKPQVKFSVEEEKYLSSEIKSLLKKGVIVESQHENGEFISPIFLVPKPEGNAYRMILNLKKLNEHMPYNHFKMETIKSVLTLIAPNCFMAKIDIKDAYYSIPIAFEHQKYLKFFYNGKLYHLW